ncbi:MAG TPA: hypothetical protein VG754_14125 [Verrucomicrobiae bacterium]|jgi:hypothetical protein|nr:hypothetical protein [Verrucomicrobiae bacterium]
MRTHPFDLKNELNGKVFEHIKDLSAHSDIVEQLLTAVKPLGDVQVFTPDGPESYRYYTVSTKGIIFGFAIGMDTIAFRVNLTFKERALASGASPCPDCGPDWVAFKAFRSDWPRPDWEFWARKAYVDVRETTP